MTIHPIDVIQHKRDGLTLSDAEIQGFIRALVERESAIGSSADSANAPADAPTDAQTAALLMAIFLRGLNPQELAALTQAMRFSGETLDTSSLHSFAVDKHSTGGVGDKASLLIAPIVAAGGAPVAEGEGYTLCDPMISGRSLGHTGGTLDKLETIPGFRTQLPLPEFLAILRQAGFAMAGQTPTLVPADRILYALRDHTGTVESPYLITASIMSKKLAAGLNALVLDVKTGSGAFMSKYADAQLLARLMVETGERAGTRTVALMTSMDQPLGRFCGNWVEVQECVELFQHFSPECGFTLPEEKLRLSGDLLALTHALSGWMLHLGGKADDARGRGEICRRGCWPMGRLTGIFCGWWRCSRTILLARRRLLPIRRRFTGRLLRVCLLRTARDSSPGWTASRSAGRCSGWERGAHGPARR